MLLGPSPKGVLDNLGQPGRWEKDQETMSFLTCNLLEAQASGGRWGGHLSPPGSSWAARAGRSQCRGSVLWADEMLRPVSPVSQRSTCRTFEVRVGSPSSSRSHQVSVHFYLRATWLAARPLGMCKETSSRKLCYSSSRRSIDSICSRIRAVFIYLRGQSLGRGLNTELQGLQTGPDRWLCSRSGFTRRCPFINTL